MLGLDIHVVGVAGMFAVDGELRSEAIPTSSG
jgi:hypothetical protein